MRGGLGGEYYVSLRTGAAVLASLPRDRYEVHDILITHVGEWHIDGIPTIPAKLSQHVDVIFNALHGEFGEDGKVQKILDIFNIPYTGSTALPSAVGMNKDLAKKTFAAVGSMVPEGIVVERGEEIHDVVSRIQNKISAPYVVKPLNGGSSIGLSFALTIPELITGIETALAYNHKAIVEEYIRGREITIGVIDSVNGKSAYATPSIEILLPEGKLFDYNQKYKNIDHPIGPARLHTHERHAIEEIALRTHFQLAARHYARYDFILSEKGPYLLEVNTLPGLTKTSLITKSLALHDIPFSKFIDYIITLALHRK